MRRGEPGGAGPARGRRLTAGRVLAIWGCLVLALLSKEQGMLLPLLLLLLSMHCDWTSRPAARRRAGAEGATTGGGWCSW